MSGTLPIMQSQVTPSGSSRVLGCASCSVVRSTCRSGCAGSKGSALTRFQSSGALIEDLRKCGIVDCLLLGTSAGMLSPLRMIWTCSFASITSSVNGVCMNNWATDVAEESEIE